MLEEVRDLQELGQSLGELIGIPTEQKTEVSVSALNEPAQLNERSDELKEHKEGE